MLLGFVFSVLWTLIQSYLSASIVKVDCNCQCKFYFEGALQVGAFCGGDGIFVVGGRLRLGDKCSLVGVAGPGRSMPPALVDVSLGHGFSTQIYSG